MNLSLFKDFDNIVVLDTETTGIDHKTDEIIELAMLRVQNSPEDFKIAEEYDKFIRLSPGRKLPPEISRLTGISPEMIENEGVSKEEAGKALFDMFRGVRDSLPYSTPILHQGRHKLPD